MTSFLVMTAMMAAFAALIAHGRGLQFAAAHARDTRASARVAAAVAAARAEWAAAVAAARAYARTSLLATGAETSAPVAMTTTGGGTPPPNGGGAGGNGGAGDNGGGNGGNGGNVAEMARWLLLHKEGVAAWHARKGVPRRLGDPLGGAFTTYLVDIDRADVDTWARLWAAPAAPGAFQVEERALEWARIRSHVERIDELGRAAERARDALRARHYADDAAIIRVNSAMTALGEIGGSLKWQAQQVAETDNPSWRHGLPDGEIDQALARISLALDTPPPPEADVRRNGPDVDVFEAKYGTWVLVSAGWGAAAAGRHVQDIYEHPEGGVAASDYAEARAEADAYVRKAYAKAANRGDAGQWYPVFREEDGRWWLSSGDGSLVELGPQTPGWAAADATRRAVAFGYMPEGDGGGDPEDGGGAGWLVECPRQFKPQEWGLLTPEGEWLSGVYGPAFSAPSNEAEAVAYARGLLTALAKAAGRPRADELVGAATAKELGRRHEYVGTGPDAGQSFVDGVPAYGENGANVARHTFGSLRAAARGELAWERVQYPRPHPLLMAGWYILPAQGGRGVLAVKGDREVDLGLPDRGEFPNAGPEGPTWPALKRWAYERLEEIIISAADDEDVDEGLGG